MLKEKENNKFVEKVVHFLPMANFGVSEKSTPELLYKLGIFRHLPYHMLSWIDRKNILEFASVCRKFPRDFLEFQGTTCAGLVQDPSS